MKLHDSTQIRFYIGRSTTLNECIHMCQATKLNISSVNLSTPGFNLSGNVKRSAV
jgi:hypothetical protein